MKFKWLSLTLSQSVMNNLKENTLHKWTINATKVSSSGVVINWGVTLQFNPELNIALRNVDCLEYLNKNLISKLK